MAGFIEFELTTDEEELAQQALENIEVAFPGWVPNEAHLEVVLAEELARIVAEAARVAANVPPAIFREFGRKLVGLEPIDGAEATVLATVTMTDDAGYTLPAGTVIARRTTSGEYELWETTAPGTAFTGTLVAVNVPLKADAVGVDRNGLASGTALELVDTQAFVASIVTTSVSEGGVDAESDEAYLDRLADELTLLTPRPILATDYAIVAKRTTGVFRALAIDGYNPADLTSNNERMVALAGVHTDGTALTAGEKTNLDAALEAMREVNFVVNVMDPTYTQVDVTFDAIAEPGADPAVVEADAEQAVKDYLDPANWGGGDDDPPVWVLDANTTRVRLYEVGAVLNDVPGLRYVTNLVMGKNGGAQAAADVLLDGVAPMPRKVDGTGGASTVVGTVTA